MDEEWRSLNDYPGYAVSNFGRVRSEFPNRTQWILKPWVLSPYGYRFVHVTDRAGRRVTGLVHRLVCFAFIGQPPTPAHEVAHFDGNPANNALPNLRWATPKENGADAVRHGSHKGERHGRHKLSNDKVKIIYDRLNKGETGSKLAREYGVSPQVICNIKYGRLWSHVTRHSQL